MKAKANHVSDVAAGALRARTISKDALETRSENTRLSFRFLLPLFQHLPRWLAGAIALILLRSDFTVSATWHFGPSANRAEKHSQQHDTADLDACFFREVGDSLHYTRRGDSQKPPNKTHEHSGTHLRKGAEPPGTAAK
jgi:hypothetical protein